MYTVIYQLVAEIKSAIKGMLAPTYREQVLGKVDVRAVFNISRVGTIAGCYVSEGKILRNAQARLIRDNMIIHSTTIASLRRFKEDAKEVTTGYECGIRLEGYNDIKVGDVIEVFTLEKVAPED